jgi:hypothetical protein
VRWIAAADRRSGRASKRTSLTLSCRAIFVCVSMALLSTGSAHGQVVDALTGKMRWWQRVAGTWQCTIHLHPVAGQSEGYGPVRITAVPTQGNTMHLHSDLIKLRADEYIGYSETAKVWWDAGAGTDGDAVLLISTDNATYTQVSDSTGTLEKDTGVYRAIYVFHGGIFAQRLELRAKDSWTAVSEEVCHRRP